MKKLKNTESAQPCRTTAEPQMPSLDIDNAKFAPPIYWRISTVS